MIKRYSRKELIDIWSEENKYKIWLDVEIAAAQAMEKLGQIPRGVSSIVRKKARINVKRIHQIEGQVKHDVIAFLTSVTEKAGIKARYLHQGMTSSDVLDTSFNIQLAQSGKIILNNKNEIYKIFLKIFKKTNHLVVHTGFFFKFSYSFSWLGGYRINGKPWRDEIPRCNEYSNFSNDYDYLELWFFKNGDSWYCISSLWQGRLQGNC